MREDSVAAEWPLDAVRGFRMLAPGGKCEYELVHFSELRLFLQKLTLEIQRVSCGEVIRGLAGVLAGFCWPTALDRILAMLWHGEFLESGMSWPLQSTGCF